MPDSRQTDSPQADLLRLRDLLERKTGLYTADDKLGRLREPIDQLQSLNGRDLKDILAAIESGDSDGARYLALLVAAVATHETYFFRTATHFAPHKDDPHPELIEKKKAQGARPFRIWSAGCSTGEEPYSIAI